MLKRLFQKEKFYVVETPYCKMYNLDEEAMERYRLFQKMNPPAYPETIREMTPQEIAQEG
ncbi:MAG: hypothetical protein ACKO0Z_09220 [Betaproteobacteria bacterium]